MNESCPLRRARQPLRLFYEPFIEIDRRSHGFL